jgi:hypothetical protein
MRDDQINQVNFVLSIPQSGEMRIGKAISGPPP